MGISDDIVPKYRHSSHEHQKPDIDWHKDSPKEDHIPDLDFDYPDSHESVKHFAIEEDKMSPADDFFQKKEIEKPKTKIKPRDRKIIKKVSSWFVAILLICLLSYIIVNNFQKISSLFNGSKTTSGNSTTSQNTTETTETTSNEIKPQDYTSTSGTTTTDQATASSSTDTATAPTAVNKTSLKIQVLNGNGIANAATSVKTTLETAGFTISSTGNAKSFSYAQTYVYYKTGKAEGAELVKAALASRTVTIENSDTVAKTYDLVVVVGKK